jgi:Ca2+-binding RTX toxin-like protein
MSLTLSTAVPSVRLEATGGKLYANGVACTDSNAAEVSIASLVSLHVEGTVDDNAAILDLASGDWSTLLDIPESISLSLGYGENSLLVFGTSGPDFFRHGMRGGDPILDLVGDGRINVLAGGVAELGVSLGDGDDKLDDLSALLSARAAEAAEAAAAAAEAAGEEAPEDADPVPPVLPLSVRLVATGGPGNDWMLGGSAGDEFDGGPGDDVISGLLGDDTLLTGEADDGADTFNGGLGYDDISYVQRSLDLVINICASEAVVGCADGECDCARMSGEPGEDDRLINVEDITGGEGDDTMYGSEASDSLSGSVGDDSIFGLGGSDVLYGQGGDDVFDGGQDGDYCDARPGEQSSACEL